MQEQKTALTVPEDLREILSGATAYTGRPEASILREAIETYLRNFERPVLCSPGVGEDTEVSSDNVKDWLRQNYRP